ncbi:DUF930 domain-containing protein [Roseibium album]|uniref:DUF930 domain-containing protein n=1 Tax=Roseibium album TaxID=311410 RepID=UPI0024922B17|nr:DUF930 domain-containing protein [Roseibium album]
MSDVGHEGIHRFVAERISWVIAVWVHVLVFAMLTNMEMLDLSDTKVSAPLVVDILSLREFLQEASPNPALQPKSVPKVATERAAPSGTGTPLQKTHVPPPNAAWNYATSFYAHGVLSDPRSAQARAALATLVGGDRLEQLCALEAMEQVRRAQPGFRPTRLAPHAFRNSVKRADEIFASAAALRSNRTWYEIAYRCQLSANGAEIIGFEFALGKPIDRSLWDEHGLAPVH